MKRVHLIIIGKVQGVSYRAWARTQAVQLGLTGWVKNLVDGTVEVVAEGEEESLQKFIKRCRQGSPAARVSQIKTNWEAATHDFSEFTIQF